VNFMRACEGLLLGLVFVVLVAMEAGSACGLAEFAAFVVVPGAVMVAFMHQGTPPQPVFPARVMGAILG
jgi:flagellar motor component MotA